MRKTNAAQSKRLMIWGIAVYAALLLLLVLVVNLEKVSAFGNTVFMLLRPIIWGLALSYLINPMFRFYERRALYRIRHMGLRRTCALILAYLSFLLLIMFVLALLLPQLYQTLSDFVMNLEGYVQSAVTQFNSTVLWINSKLSSIGIDQSLLHPLDPEGSEILSINFLLSNIGRIMSWAELFLNSDGALSVVEIFGTVMDVFTDLLFAFFVSLYFLTTKEKRYAQVMKVRSALFSDRLNAAITKICTVTDRTFGGFIRGKLIESFFVALLAYLLFLIFAVPYPLLIAVIGGIANIIPFVGPIIGVIPAVVIVLLAKPSAVIPMILIVIVIQQLDKNIVSPKLLFNNYGVSSLGVLISITTVGTLFGFWGLILGVPLFATVIELVADNIDLRLRKQGLPSNTENHYPVDSMVDPAKDVRTTPDTIIKGLERKIMRLQLQLENGTKLSRSGRFWIALYHFCLRHHIINEMSDETLLYFSADEATLAAAEETDELIRHMQGVDLLDKT